MSDTKEIYISSLRVGNGTGVEVKPSIQAETIDTFDGPVNNGNDKISWEVSIEKLRYGTVKEYTDLEKLLFTMLTQPEPIKLIENVTMKDGSAKVTEIIYNCIISDKNYKWDTKSKTVENLTFKGEKLKKWVNNTLVTP